MRRGVGKQRGYVCGKSGKPWSGMQRGGGREGISDCRTGFLRDKTDWIGVAMGSCESYALGNCNAPTEENGCEKMGKWKSVASTA